MQNENKRLPWVDMAKGIAIILVVCGHTDVVPLSLNEWLSWFHLPVFFVISGFLMARSGQRTGNAQAGTVIKGYLRSLMIPYLWFSFGALIIDYLKCVLGRMDFGEANLHLVQTVTLRGYSVLWFLPALCIGKILVFFVTKKMKPVVAAVVLSIVTVGLFYCRMLGNNVIVLGTVLYLVTKWCLAASFVAWGMTFEKRLSEENGGFCVQALLGWVVLVCIVAVSKIFGLQSMNDLKVTYMSLYIAIGTLGSLALLFICKSLSELKALCFLGRNSLIIMCTHLHFYVMYLALKLLKLFPIVFGNMYLGVITVVVLTLIFEVPVIYIINRFFPFVLGKKSVLGKKKK